MHIKTARQYGDWYRLAVDGLAVTFGTAREDWAGCGPAQYPLAVPNVTVYPSTAIVQTS